MGSSPYEIEHISDHAERVWLRKAIESDRSAASSRRTSASVPPSADPGPRPSSGTCASRSSARNSSRSRGSTCSCRCSTRPRARGRGRGPRSRDRDGASRPPQCPGHTIGRPYESVLREFEGERPTRPSSPTPRAERATSSTTWPPRGRGDGRRRDRGHDCTESEPSRGGRPRRRGRARAEQTDRTRRRAPRPVGRAARAHPRRRRVPRPGRRGRDVELQSLEGYSTGGTLHLITNNQVGFTTDPMESRSTRYSSDLAKGFDIPIVHVNADDPEAAISAIRLALAYGSEFGHDASSTSSATGASVTTSRTRPAYTQPCLVERIEWQPTVQGAVRRASRRGWGPHASRRGRLAAASGRCCAPRTVRRLSRALHEHRSSASGAGRGGPARGGNRRSGRHGRRRRRLVALNEQLLAVPEGFTVNPKLARQLERRHEAVLDGGIDWGQAEVLAFASLLEEGIPIRLAGQDTERGTFSHRHLMLHDAATGETYAPIQHLPGANASFEVYNSPLSEYAVLGFEYGYSIATPDVLVLWEAQFGDFVNGAQIVVDQFIVAGRAKWKQTTRLTLLLPHGYEGNGPEHSSARLERYLQLVRRRTSGSLTDQGRAVFPPAAPAGLAATERPLVVMTPKGLLRFKAAASSPRGAQGRRFRPVIDDAGADHGGGRRGSCCAPARSITTAAGKRARRGSKCRDSSARAVLSVPAAKPARDARQVSERNERAGVGAGRAAEHGRRGARSGTGSRKRRA